MTNVFDELQWRGLIYDTTEGLREILASERLTAYVGFDPTASSLHIGNLLHLITLARLQRAGHTPIAIAGGGTGMIGDPSGKSQERSLLTREQMEANLAGIKPQLAQLFDFHSPDNAAIVVNNYDWLGSFGLLDFLRDTGKHFTVNYMLQKESVNRRLGSEDGISYTEFSYLLLQARDFLELFDRYGCTLQMGGSDQWGNITAGIELIRRLRAKKAHGLVTPLMTTASGAKFGKTEAGTIWLDPARTAPFQFYQFWLNTDDRDVVSYLKFFTFLAADEIAQLEDRVRTAPETREAQRALARSVTALVHGDEEVQKAERAAQQLFSGNIWSLPLDDVLASLGDAPSTSVTIGELEEGRPLGQWLTDTGLTSSRSEATRLIRGGGVSINDRPIPDERYRLTAGDLWNNSLVVLGKGKRHRHVLKARTP